MRRSFQVGFWLFAGIVLLTAWVFRAHLRSRIALAGVLANDSPLPEVVEEVILNAPDPQAAFLAAWNSGKIIHREASIRSLRQVFPMPQKLPTELQTALAAAALDPDTAVREMAFSILSERQDAALPALATAQLHDADPQVRLLGLSHLKHGGAAVGVPVVLPLLADPDPTVVVMSLKLLENWSGEEFGAKLSDSAAIAPDNRTGDGDNGLRREKIRAAADRARLWWERHQSQFQASALTERAPSVGARLIPAGDFQLRTLENQLVRLSDFRGKVVLINFWTTWCPACVGEIPELIALQQEHPDRLVILGVSLDFVPDEHGHLDGPAAVEDSTHHASDHGVSRSRPGVKLIREKVARTVRARNMNYRILLDERNEVGGRFNGGELPTTVIVDARGNIQRRFVGSRSQGVFAAMLAEAGLEFPAATKK